MLQKKKKKEGIFGIVTVEVNSLGPYFKNYYGHIRHFNLIFFVFFFSAKVTFLLICFYVNFLESLLVFFGLFSWASSGYTCLKYLILLWFLIIRLV